MKRKEVMTMAQNPIVTFTMENGDIIKAELIPDGSVKAEEIPCPEIPDARICLRIGNMRLTDYASAGQTYSEDSLMAAWIHRQ